MEGVSSFSNETFPPYECGFFFFLPGDGTSV